jgi:hypothetical protein
MCLFTGAIFSAQMLFAANSQSSIVVASGGHARVAILAPEKTTGLYPYAASELARYLKQLSGADIPIASDADVASRPASDGLIVLGGAEAGKTAHEAITALRMNLTGLRVDGFLIKTGRLHGHAVIVIAGNDDRATLYGAYELIERLGVTFRLTGDIIPRPSAELRIPALDVRMEPAMARRGFLLQESGYENMTMFSYDDYVRLIDQMAKMKCNYMQFWWFPFSPWLKYSYKGESKYIGDISNINSGYMTWAYGGFGSRTTDDVTIGKDLFTGRRIAPPEMQSIETPDQAFDVAQTMLQKIIHHASERGIKVWPAIELASLPPNLARHTEEVGELPFQNLMGAFAHPLDDVNREIQVKRLKALVATYPEAEGYFLNVGEMYPELDNEKHRAFFDAMRPKYFELRAARFPWVIDIPSDSDAIVDSNIGNFDLFQYLLKQRDLVAPQAKIGLMGIGRGYALPLFNRMLPKDVPFTDMESTGMWTPSGVPMQIFGGEGDRERTIEPRVDDDFEMMGMQFNVREFTQDKIFSDGLKNGLTGFAGQVDRARGTETNSLFLAEAAWTPNLTPEDFYKDYAQRMFGAKAAPKMYEALMTLEDNQTYLGYNRYPYFDWMLHCCTSLPAVNVAHRYFLQGNAFDGPTLPDWNSLMNAIPDANARFEGSMALLSKALDSMRAAQPDVAPQGEYELRYMINRTQAFHDFIGSLVTMYKAYQSFDHAFRIRNRVSQDDFVAALNTALEGFHNAGLQAQAATREYTELMDSPSDLGVLYHLNAQVVLGFDLVYQTFRNIVNYHEGKPYLDHIEWERLFSPDLHTN